MKVGVWIVLLVSTLLLLPWGITLVGVLSGGWRHIDLSWLDWVIMIAPYPMTIGAIALGISIRRDANRYAG